MIRLLLIFCLVARCAMAGTPYFVDFAGGSDASSGLDTLHAWKHCPGDGNATGVPAGTTPAAGSIINFKGGVVYNGEIIVQYSGTAGNPITFISDEANWGTGRAINDGYFGGTTNASAFLIGYTSGGANITVSGFEIRNQQVSGVQVFGNSVVNTVITNNIVHHIGDWPNDGINYNAHGFGVKWDNCQFIVVVSNAMYDLNETWFYLNGGAGAGGGAIAWGNDVSNVQDHAIIGLPVNSYFLGAYNTIHDQTNLLSHDDNIHIQGFYPGPSGAFILCNNRIWNGNQDFFVNTLVNSGSAYVFNNVFTQTGSADGTAGNQNGIVINVNQANGWSNICIFNNTICLKNGGSAGVRISNRTVAPYVPGTNYLFANNIMYNSLWNYNDVPGAGSKPDPTNVVYFFSGYNAQTNSVFGYALPASEVHSVYGNINFVSFILSSPSTSDLHLAPGSVGIGQGTNLSNVFPSNLFSFLPARYAIDPTMDATGSKSRGSIWDIGAFQGQVATGPRVMKVTNLHVGRSYTGP